MARLADSAKGAVPDRILDPRELTDEQEAVRPYEALAAATGDALARGGLQNIADEEGTRIGKFRRLLSHLPRDETRGMGRRTEELGKAM